MKIKKKRLIASFMILSILFTGCNTPKPISKALDSLSRIFSGGNSKSVPNSGKVKDLPAAEEQTLAEVSKNLSVDVYLDGTPSMGGYVAQGSSTAYCRTISVLEDGAANVWPLCKIAFNKFGNTIAPLANREYIRATTPDFYAYSEEFIDTHVDMVLDQAKPENLSVIVTDLFENESDINVIASKIRDKYLAKDMAFGLIAVRSEFSGNIYDVGINAYSFWYASGAPETQRPFYVLILGKHQDVAAYYDKLLNAGLSSIKEKNFVLFSKNIVNPKLSLKDASLVDADKLINIGSLFEGDKKDNRVKQFKLNKNTTSADVTFKTPYQTLANTMQLDTNKLEVTTEVKVCKDGVLTKCEDLNDCIKVTNKMEKGNMNTTLQFDTKGFPSKQVVAFEITMKPGTDAFALPEWVSKWDMDVSKIEEWKNNPDTFNGSTTINLKRFVSGLWQGTMQMHKPEVGHFIVYLIKD